MTTQQVTAIWETKEPATNRCSICGSRNVYWFESRLTGVGFRKQMWAYCKRCYRACVLGDGNGSEAELAKALNLLLLAISAGVSNGSETEVLPTGPSSQNVRNEQADVTPPDAAGR